MAERASAPTFTNYSLISGCGSPTHEATPLSDVVRVFRGSALPVDRRRKCSRLRMLCSCSQYAYLGSVFHPAVREIMWRRCAFFRSAWARPGDEALAISGHFLIGRAGL